MNDVSDASSALYDSEHEGGGGGGVGGERLFEARRLFTVNQSVAVLIFRVGTYSTFGAYSNKSSMQ